MLDYVTSANTTAERVCEKLYSTRKSYPWTQNYKHVLRRKMNFLVFSRIEELKERKKARMKFLFIYCENFTAVSLFLKEIVKAGRGKTNVILNISVNGPCFLLPLSPVGYVLYSFGLPQSL